MSRYYMESAQVIDKLEGRLSVDSFRKQLHHRLYVGKWDDAASAELDRLSNVSCHYFGSGQSTSANSYPYGETQDSIRQHHAEKAFQAALSNMVSGMIEYNARGEPDARNAMDILRDIRTAENQLMALMQFTGFAGEETIKEQVRSYKALVNAELGHQR